MAAELGTARTQSHGEAKNPVRVAAIERCSTPPLIPAVARAKVRVAHDAEVRAAHERAWPTE